MNKTKIEWCDYTINPIKGLCKHACWYCYARRMYKRFGWNEEVTLRLDELDRIAKIKNPSRIFICSTHDLFGDWISDKWIFDIITKCQRYPQHTFLLLTKNPKRYLDFTFRDNFWLGITNTGEAKAKQYKIANAVFEKHKNGFISFEPLLDDYGVIPRKCKWVIIGGLTPKPTHSFRWIENILIQADERKIPVFIKHNANCLMLTRQEFLYYDPPHAE